MNFPLYSFVLFMFIAPYSAWGRDPFWPIGYNGKKQPPEKKEVVTEVVEAPPKERVLTAAEMRELARMEAERIRQELDRRGTMEAAGKIYAYVEEKWVTIGDVIIVEVLGNKYRLQITNLTKDNIELEAHRAAGSLQNQTKTKP